MRRTKSFSNRQIFIAAVLLYSVVFAGCAGESNTNTAANSSSTVPTEYSRKSTAATNSNATSMATPDSMSGDTKAESERYAEISENPFLETVRAPLSTFSIDVDTASYSNVRRFLNQGSLPPKEAVRIEEMVNYFEYDYPQPTGDVPFSVNTEVAACPWNAKHKIVQIGLQGKKVSLDNVPPSNLVFLVDVSGSMASPDKLPLLKQGLKMLVNQLSDKDRV